MLTDNIASAVFSSMAGESEVIPMNIQRWNVFLVFDLLREQLHMIFWTIPTLTQAKVSLDRTDDFLHNVRDNHFHGHRVDIPPLDRAAGRVC